MKLKGRLTKSLAVLLTFVILFSSLGMVGVTASADDDLTDEEQKALIEERIAETEETLEALADEEADTEEYLSTLNTKISYLEDELTYIEDEIAENEDELETLKLEYVENGKAIEKTEAEIESLQLQIEEQQAQFEEDYALYAERMKAMYVSGSMSVIEILLTSEDLSQFLTRLEMISRVSKQDGELLEAINDEIEAITESEEQLAAEQENLEAQQIELLATFKSVESSTAELESKQAELEESEEELAADQAEANALLEQLSEETGYYTEYLESDEEALASIDAAIEAAAKKYAESLTTTTTTTTTTKKSSSSSSSSSTTTTTTKSSSSSSKYISLIYPVPTCTTISCGWYGYSGHTGVDFSCATGSEVVASESGIVIISTDLTNSDGSYRSYGRYIVIMHDKTTSSGEVVYTLYAHNSYRLVSAGDYVSEGQVIAYSGSTGNSTGPHLHFEVRVGGSSQSYAVNPLLYLP